MSGFKITTGDNVEIKFELYHDTAPITSKAFIGLLPFTRIFGHARVSGQEIWIDNVPPLDIIQENASVFTEPGEVVFGPSKPTRTKTVNCFGIYYGEGKGLDACNILQKLLRATNKNYLILVIPFGKMVRRNSQYLSFEKVLVTL